MENKLLYYSNIEKYHEIHYNIKLQINKGDRIRSKSFFI